MALGDLVAAMAVGGANRRHVSVPELKRLLPFMVAGHRPGRHAARERAAGAARESALGALRDRRRAARDPQPVAQGTRSRRGGASRPGRWRACSRAVFGAGGPVNVAYLAGRLRDKGEIRSTVSVIISVSATLRTAGLRGGGPRRSRRRFSPGVALAVPFALGGHRLGSRIHIGPHAGADAPRHRRAARRERRRPPRRSCSAEDIGSPLYESPRAMAKHTGTPATELPRAARRGLHGARLRVRRARRHGGVVVVAGRARARGGEDARHGDGQGRAARGADARRPQGLDEGTRARGGREARLPLQAGGRDAPLGLPRRRLLALRHAQAHARVHGALHPGARRASTSTAAAAATCSACRRREVVRVLSPVLVEVGREE